MLNAVVHFFEGWQASNFGPLLQGTLGLVSGYDKDWIGERLPSYYDPSSRRHGGNSRQLEIRDASSIKR